MVFMSKVRRGRAKSNLPAKLREVGQKKRTFYGQADLRVAPSPLRSAFRDLFFEVSKKQVFLVQKHCFQPFLVGQDFLICLVSGPIGLTIKYLGFL